MEFIDDRLDQGHREEFYGKESLDARIIDEDHFVTETLEQLASLPERKPTLGEVLEAVLDRYR
jgi:hypothetical protein